MASYTATVDGQDIDLRVTGLTSGDEIYVVLRYADDADGYVAGTPKTYTASGSSFSRTYSVDPGVYMINVRVEGTWLGAKTLAVDEEITRPDNWVWYNLNSNKVNCNLLAQDWNEFLGRINEFRGYKGLVGVTLYRVESGQQIKASTINEARDAISSIPGHGTLPARAVSMQTELTVSYLNRLASALNAVS